MGAGQDKSTRNVNLDVSGTPGPDYLGQETVDVNGHPADRPGVTWRRPEEDPDDPRIRRMDTGEELPVLLSSDMRADPIEGVQGSYSEIIEGECARCGYDRLVSTVHTLAGEHQEQCNACGAIQTPHSDDGYRMPLTDEERAKREREVGVKLGSISPDDVYDMEPNTGYGPYISLVNDSGTLRMRKQAVDDLYWLLVENDDIDATESAKKHLDKTSLTALSLNLLPDGISISGTGDGK